MNMFARFDEIPTMTKDGLMEWRTDSVKTEYPHKHCLRGIPINITLKSCENGTYGVIGYDRVPRSLMDIKTPNN